MIRIVGICLLLVACQTPNTERAYPSRPLSFIVPWEAESAAGTASQILADALENELEQSVDVVYKAGYEGLEDLVHSEIDGYTLGMIGTDVAIRHWTGITLADYHRYIPIALIGATPTAITVHTDAPWNTIHELVSALKTNPGNITASGTYHGGIWDLDRIGFLDALHLDPSALSWQPSQNEKAAIEQLLQGNVDMVLTTVSDVDSLRKEGRVRTLAVMAAERISFAPDVPTLRENGIDYDSPGSWIMLATPMKVPGARLEFLRVAAWNLSRKPSFRKAFANTGFQLHYTTGTTLEIFLQDEDSRNGELMKKAGLSLEKR